jgi:NAD(P)-dependent dehydrogenase (short-subunit alcohol dehydrogenase family)
MGYQVFAGCLDVNSLGANELRAESSQKLHVIKLNVTQNKEVEEAVNYVQNNLKGNKLWAIVNNAGIASYTGTEWGADTESMYSPMFEVNTLGTVRVTRGFLPLLRPNRGARVVLVGSMADRVALPAIVPYSMSKFAVRAYGDGLRRELKTCGINVSIIEPVMYSTPLTATQINLQNLKTNWSNTPQPLKESIGESDLRAMTSKVEALLGMRRQNAEEVVDAMVQSVAQKEPLYYYRVYGIQEMISFWFMETMPEQVQDLFLEGNTFSMILKLIKNKR